MDYMAGHLVEIGCYLCAGRTFFRNRYEITGRHFHKGHRTRPTEPGKTSGYQSRMAIHRIAINYWLASVGIARGSNAGTLVEG